MRRAWILADEPTGSLDEQTGDSVRHLCSASAPRQGTALVSLTQTRAMCGELGGACPSSWSIEWAQRPRHHMLWPPRKSVAASLASAPRPAPCAHLCGIARGRARRHPRLSTEARATEICERHHCRRFASLEELGARPATPSRWSCRPTATREVALPLLARGCHLLIEKPLCASLEEAEQVLAAARQHGGLVQVGHVEHFNPVMAFP